MQVAQNRHLLHLRWNSGHIRVNGAIIVGDAKIRIGADERFVQHLLLLVAHVRDQQAKEGYQLLDLPSQH